MSSRHEVKTQTIAALERMQNTANGNPRWRVAFTDGTSALTKTDADVAYGLGNTEFQGVPVIVTYEGGQIVYVAVAK